MRASGDVDMLGPALGSLLVRLVVCGAAILKLRCLALQTPMSCCLLGCTHQRPPLRPEIVPAYLQNLTGASSCTILRLLSPPKQYKLGPTVLNQ